MRWSNIIFTSFLAFVRTHPDPVPGYNIEEPLYYDTFPEGFLWGTATAAYQVLYYTGFQSLYALPVRQIFFREINFTKI